MSSSSSSLRFARPFRNTGSMRPRRRCSRPLAYSPMANLDLCPPGTLM
jgi:hypothetical protein